LSLTGIAVFSCFVDERDALGRHPGYFRVTFVLLAVDIGAIGTLHAGDPCPTAD